MPLQPTISNPGTPVALGTAPSTEVTDLAVIVTGSVSRVTPGGNVNAELVDSSPNWPWREVLHAIVRLGVPWVAHVAL
jgi:hypothetical protein